jgi:protein SCO1/2
MFPSPAGRGQGWGFARTGLNISLRPGIIFLVLFFTLTTLRAESVEAQKAVLKKVDFVQKLNAQLPLEASFRDEAGNTVALKQYFGDRPVILVPIYFQCPLLCSETMNGLLRALRSVSFDAGKEFRVVAFSFDPKDTPADALAKKKQTLLRYGRPHAEDGWTFLTGDANAIAALTDRIGFHFAYDDELKQYAHSTGIIVVTPQGKLARYFYGVEYSAKDLRLALIEASHEKIGSPVDKLLLYCYSYDPLTGKYSVMIQRVLRLAAAVTVLLLTMLVGGMLLRERRRTRSARGPR